MELELMQIIFAVGLLLVIFLIINKFIVNPSGIVLRAGYSLILGMVFLWGFNFLGGNFGMHIPANFVTVVIAGFLGLPGLGLIVVLQNLI